jgi:hypothetical protein
VPQVPVGQQAQGSMFDLNDLRAEYGEHLVNQTRDAIRDWRQSGYRGVTSRVTRDLLDLLVRQSRARAAPEAVLRAAGSRRNRHLAQRSRRKIECRHPHS